MISCGMRKPEPRTLPRFAPRRPADPCPDSAGASGSGPARPGTPPPAAVPRFTRALEVLHKLLTGGAALGAILRLFF